MMSSSSRKSLRSYITERYGSDSYESITRLSKLKTKKARYQNHIIFLKKCRDNNIIPKGLRVKSIANSWKARKIDRDAGMARVRERLESHKHTVSKLIRDASSVETTLQNRLSEDDFQKVMKIIKVGADKEYEEVSTTQKKKFEALEKARNESNEVSKRKIVNMSTKTLSEAQIGVLNKGLKFAVAPTQIPRKEMIVAIESSLTNVDKTTADTVRVLAAEMIQKARPPKSNVTDEERKAIKQLQQMEDIVILPADKGNVTVIMDKLNYQEKIDQMLSDSDTYRSIKKDPSSRAEREVRESIKKQNADIRVNLSNTTMPRFVGCPKIHKEGAPLRPVIDSRDSATYDLAKRLTRIIQPVVGKTSSYVKNSTHLVSILSELKVDTADILVSFDVKSLFTSVPVEEACRTVEKKLEADDDLIDRSSMAPKEIAALVKTCLETTYFSQNGKFFQQTEGASMGSPLSPVIASLYMEEFEEKAIQESERKPKTWIRYVDDVLAVWPHGEGALQEFLAHLNRQNEAIQFTMEIEDKNELAFLDVKIKRTGTDLRFKVHRKSTHSDLYLQWDSNHAQASKMAVVRALVDRAFNVCSPENLNEELNYVKETLKKNGFPVRVINKYISKKRNKKPGNEHQRAANSTTDNHTSTQPKSLAVLPYVEGLTQNLCRLLKKNNIKCAMSSRGQTLKDKLPSAKDKKPPETKPCIYKIPCRCGKKYIGQTKRKLETRIKEHQRDIRQDNHAGSAFVDHIFEPGEHGPLWNKTSVIENENNLTRRLTKEALNIHIDRSNTINRMDGTAFSTLWDKCLKLRM